MTAKQGSPARRSFLFGLIFVWLSLTLHLYILFAVAQIPAVVDLINRMRAVKENKPVQVQNILLQTAEEAPPPKEANAISDKNAADAAPIFDLSKPRAYNFAGQSAAVRTGDTPEDENSPAKDSGRVRTQAVQSGGQQAPFLYDPAQAPTVNLYASGNISLAAEAKDYASYFLEMQKKIGKYHKEFFPVYQYYQGLLRDGVVVVDFTVDKNGDIAKAEIVTSYGSDAVDSASLNAIIYAKNFGPLPPELAKQGFIKIRFHFVYFSR